MMPITAMRTMSFENVRLDLKVILLATNHAKFKAETDFLYLRKYAVLMSKTV
jgi:hypothetical protein